MNSALSLVLFALVGLAACDKAPYPPSGAKPAKAFLLPLRQPASGSAAYTAPSFSAPPQGFSAPSFSAPIYAYAPAEEQNARQEVEVISTPAPAPKEPEAGQYYILSPEGKLQKVEYFTAEQPQSEFAQKAQQYNQKSAKQQFKGAVSNFQYRDVEPISAPVYSYTNVPGPLVRILRRAENF